MSNSSSGETDGHRRPGFSLALATGILALVTGTAGLVFDFIPQWRPDPRERQAASLKSLTIEPSVSMGEYLTRTDEVDAFERTQQANGAEKKQILCKLLLPGTLVYLNVTIEGFKRRSTYLKYYTYDAKRRTRLPDEKGVSNDYVATSVSGEAPTDQAIALAWVRAPYKTGSYFIRYELYHERGRSGAGDDLLLAFADTPPFSVNYETVRETLRNEQCLTSS